MIPMNIVAISGSLKNASYNTAVLRALAALGNDFNMKFNFFNGLDALPHFSPERDGDHHTAVNQLRYEIKEAHGVIICTPEYAFGIPGVLKNALDWLVSSGELNEKVVAAISASPLPSGGDKAHASLMNTLTALGCHVPEKSKLQIPMVRKKIDVNSNVLEESFRVDLKKVLLALKESVQETKEN